MPNPNGIQELARKQAQKTLGATPSFYQLSKPEQLKVYKNLIDANEQALMAQQSSLTTAMEAKPKKASDLINDARHENRRIEQAGDLAGDFVEAVDFPKFVRDLLKGVFDANIQVMLAQTDNFIKMMKAATAPLAKYMAGINDTAAFGYLADQQSDDFSIDFDDQEKDEDGQPKAILTDKEGQKVDIGDNEIKAKIMDAKIAMAKEQRALLRETLLMGITRLVIEKGVVKASVVFDFKAGEDIKKADKAALKKSVTSGSSISHSGGFLGSIFGGPSGGYSRSERESQISVSSAKSHSTTDLAAKITGNVEINFKSDYFKLDNFAAMYGQIKEEQQQANAAAPGAAPAALPPKP